MRDGQVRAGNLANRVRNAVLFGWVLSGSGGADIPVLSSPNAGTPNSTGTVNATVSLSVVGSGRLYWAVVTNTGSATNAQIKAGTGGNIVAGSSGSQVVTTGGTQTVASLSGLTTGTLYQLLFLETGGNGQDSAQSSVNLTTT
jgi:hypothetical protein